ncbi:ABC transporter ATP-binding protein [Kluyvera georgiana]|uniref:ABC transporter ATP-binding protein n=1 Tax=Kluyvera georgiana TaxID=73098 RepID=UPI00322044BE
MSCLIVESLGKAYKRYNSKTGRLLEWLFPFVGPKHTIKWIIKDINFVIEPGESLGIIGVNGAGKSTLLKMITGTTKPTEGSVTVNGRVAAMLELGMGFHPEFTGRQNAYMSGQLLGMSVEEITRLMPEIEAFAEIGPYIDQPVRVYSSGMQVRLAFSVATIIRPDLLIIDEALSVGDIYFQQKCVERIESFKSQGTSILFVTHDFSSLHKICDRALLLAAGNAKYLGKTVEVVEKYYGYLNTSKAIVKEESIVEHKFVKINEFIRDVSILDQSGEVVNCLEVGKAYEFIAYTQGISKYDAPHVGFRIQDRLGQVIYETNTYCQRCDVNGKDFNKVSFKFMNNLCAGEYTLAMGVESGGHGDGLFDTVIALTERVLSFQVIDNPTLNKWAGLVNIEPTITID